MQEEPRKETDARLRRIQVSGSGGGAGRGPNEDPADNPTVENPTGENPASERPMDDSPTAGDPVTGDPTPGNRGPESPMYEDPAVRGREAGGPTDYSYSEGYSRGYPEREPLMEGSGHQQMSAQDEQTWSVLSHLSVLTGLIGLMPFGALIIWLVYKDRSPRVGFHALQSLWYQIAWLVIFVILGTVGVVIGGILALVTFGLALFILVPLAILIGLIPFVHGCYAAYKVSQGVDYRYPFVADKIGGPRRTI